MYAHAGHRVPIVKRVEKRLEGTDSSSGIGADLLALGYELARRNQELTVQMLDALVSQGTVAIRGRREKRKVQREAKRQARAARRHNPQGG